MIAAKLLSGLVARATFRRSVTARVRRLVRKRGREGHFEKVSRPPGGVPPKYPDGRGGTDHFVLDASTGDGCPVRLSANMRPFYRSEVLASVEVDGELVYMRTKGGGVETMADSATWFRVIDEMEGSL